MQKEILDQIKFHALDFPSYEIGGIVVKDLFDELHVIKNDTAGSESKITISPKTYLKAKNIGEIKYYYHSQPENEEFSVQDKKVADDNGVPLILYCVAKDKFNYYYPADPKGFEIGKNDCFTFIESYYADLGIKLPKFFEDRTEEWYKQNPKAIEEGAKKLGFIEVLFPEKYDVISLYKKKNVPGHLAIYLSDMEILHYTKTGVLTKRLEDVKPLIHKCWRYKQRD